MVDAYWQAVLDDAKAKKAQRIEYREQKLRCEADALLKRKTGFHKSKKQRQAWWKNLSEVDRQAYLERVQERKAEKRRAKSIKLMQGNHYDCALCIHGQIKNCTDNLKDGCEYYYNAQTNKHGPAYKIKPKNNIHQEIKSA